MKKLFFLVISVLMVNAAFAQVNEQADVKLDGAFFTPTTIAGCNATLSMQISNATASTQIPVGGFTAFVAGPVGANRAYTFKSTQPTGTGMSWTFNAADNVWVGTNTVILTGGQTLTYTFGVEGTNVTATPVATDVSVTPNASWVQHANSPLNDAVAPTASVSQACGTINTITVTSSNPNPTIGDNVTLTASGCPNGGTYSWAPAGGTSGGTGGNTYTVAATNSSVTYTASCSEGGSGNINVVGQAVTPFTVSPPSQSVNVGTAVNLTASGCTGTVTWSTGASGATLSINAVAGTTTYTATCSDARTASGTVTGTTTPISVSPSTASVTVGTSQNFTATGCTGGVITWSNGAQGASTSVVATQGTQTITANCSLGGSASATLTGTAVACAANAGTLN